MPTLAQVRAKYPQYAGLSDKAFVDTMYNKYYSNMPRAQFDQRLQLQQGAPNARVTAPTQPKPAAQPKPAPQPQAQPRLNGWGQAAGALANFNAAIPFGDEFNDAGVAAITSATTGKPLSQAWQEQRARSANLRAAYNAQHPWGASIARTAAAVPALAAAALTGGASEVPAAAEAGSGLLAGLRGGLTNLGEAAGFRAAPVGGQGLLASLPRHAMNALRAGTVGGLTGWGQGFASEGSLPERIQHGNESIAPGAAMGVAIPAAVGTVAAGANKVSRALASPETKAAVRSARILQAKAPQAFSPGNVAQGEELPFETWDGGPAQGGQGEQLAQAVAANGPGKIAAQQAFLARRAGARARLEGATQQATGATGSDYYPTIQMTKASQQARAAPLYQQAEQTPIDPIDFNNHLGPLIDTPWGRQAFDSASKIANIDELVSGKPSGFQHNIIQDGKVDTVQIPTAKTLDYLTQGWDQQLAPYRNKYTGELELGGDKEAQGLLNLRNEFVRRLGVVSPSDAAARASWVDEAQQLDALKRGRGYVGSNVDPELIAQRNENLRPEDLQAQRVGIARGISDQVQGPNPRNFVRNITDNPNFASRLRTAFADDPSFQALSDAAQREGNYEQSYQHVLSGSRTTPLSENIASTNAAAEDPGNDVGDFARNVVADTISGKSIPHQVVKGIAGLIRPGKSPYKALNDPAVSQMLGDVVFGGKDPASILQNAARQNIISPHDVVNLMPYLAGAAGTAAGNQTGQDYDPSAMNLNVGGVPRAAFQLDNGQ